MDDFVLDDEEKLRQGFTSADELEQVDIGDGSKTRPMCISNKLVPEFKQGLIDCE
jgi:hypothetical protein